MDTAYLALLCTVFLLPFSATAQEQHDYKVELYDRLHDSPMQQKFRQLAPMPAGAVYVQHPGEGEAEIRQHFRNMKRLGFTALKQIQTVPGWTFEDVAMIALDEGLIPWWYGEGGWAPITPDLMDRLGIPSGTTVQEARDDPRMVAYQTDLLRERVRKMAEQRASRGAHLRSSSVAFDPQVGGRGYELTDDGRRLFVEWVKERYQDIERLNHAWNMHHFGLAPGGEPFRSWDDFEARWQQVGPKEYRHLRDIVRFKADNSLQNNRRTAERFRERYEHAPYRGGGELGLFLPQAWYGVDLEGIADLMAEYGSFYPSMHFSWHFSEVDHEVVRPVFMQASLAHDYFKGGWSAAWESTGGPQQFSGGDSGLGFTVDEGVMTQFVLNHLAAGFKGFGLWAWSPRSAGWEAGEYSLVDRQGEVTPRAEKVGRIGQAMQRYRDELWQARKEPLVGVYVDWDSEAIWAALSVQGRDEFKQWPISARVGVSRALINADVPFEYVTASDLRSGLAPRYRVIYMPAVLAVPDDILETLSGYVRGGGRLVLDMPGAYFDVFGAMRENEEGSVFEQLFGVEIDHFQYAGVNVPYRLGGLDLEGFTVDLTPTSATVLERYDGGAPAVTENDHGNGTAVLLGYEASMLAFEPGNEAAERKLLRHALGDYEPFFGSEEAIVYRLAGGEADHYFLLNDGPATAATLDTGRFEYGRAIDAVTGEDIALDRPIPLESHSGRWLRLEK